MKRLRKPKLQDGELRMYWGRERTVEPAEIMYAWQGDRSMRGDSALLYYAIGSRHPDPHVMPIFSKMKPSLLEELDARGYDLSTLKFSIKKKIAQ